MPNDIIVVSGGFDPLHPGHIALFDAASAYGPLTVILNSDPWLLEKKGYRVMNWHDRATILRSLKSVSAVEPVDDRDKTVCEALRRIKPKYFAKSGDRLPASMPESELATCNALGIEILYNVCPHLPYSSSQLVTPQANQEKVWRPWGSYLVYDHGIHPVPPHWKAKRLDLAPGQRISYQCHADREEHWVIVRGSAAVRLGKADRLTAHGVGTYVHVPCGTWHQIVNLDTFAPLTLVEVQLGRQCSELDIRREGDMVPEPTVSMQTLSLELSDA